MSRNHQSAFMHAAAIVAIIVVFAPAEPPPALPGVEISNSLIRSSVPPESVATAVPVTSPSSPTWLDEAMKTWESHTVAQQMVEDESSIPLGKGALFVPTMSTPAQEPETEVLDSAGRLIVHGKPGKKISLLPGSYFVLMGSGTHRQRLVRSVTVAEGITTPVVPGWGGLAIDVVDENSVPFRGEYEMARIDKFEPLGRAFGPDPNQGEEAKVWILPPGTYKIFGVGESYNTLSNFVTVTLLPGRLTRFLLVQNSADPLHRIIGGGEVVAKVNQSLDPYWKYGFDVGGSALFNAIIDRNSKSQLDLNTASATLLFSTWLHFRKTPFDWNTYLRLEEWPTISWSSNQKRFDVSNLTTTRDEIRLPSLFLWHILPWLGPYGRAQIQSHLFPQYANRDGSTEQRYFYMYDPTVGSREVDSNRTGIQIRAALSPLITESGVGINLDVLKTRYIESQLRGGFGYKIDYAQQGYQSIDAKLLPDSLRLQDSAYIRQSVIIQHTDEQLSQGYGPELAFNATARVGNWATVTSELRLFAAIAPELRIANPDVDWRATLSWRLSQVVTLDYQYIYTLNHDLAEDLSVHAVLIRFSASSR